MVGATPVMVDRKSALVGAHAAVRVSTSMALLLSSKLVKPGVKRHQFRLPATHVGGANCRCGRGGVRRGSVWRSVVPWFVVCP